MSPVQRLEFPKSTRHLLAANQWVEIPKLWKPSQVVNATADWLVDTNGKLAKYVARQQRLVDSTEQMHEVGEALVFGSLTFSAALGIDLVDAYRRMNAKIAERSLRGRSGANRPNEWELMDPNISWMHVQNVQLSYEHVFDRDTYHSRRGERIEIAVQRLARLSGQVHRARGTQVPKTRLESWAARLLSSGIAIEIALDHVLPDERIPRIERGAEKTLGR